MKSILDPAFRYVPAAETDIRKTFKRVQREQRAREAVAERNAAREAVNLTHLYPTRKAKP